MTARFILLSTEDKFLKSFFDDSTLKSADQIRRILIERYKAKRAERGSSDINPNLQGSAE